ncbi:MAG: DNA polymerase III subunit beta [Planctomycetaceae bacterium]|nr:DNA polymerase III subunit beta [Planctomycetaceae bacterium]MBP62121.1 DNA polymerase III subunit beta [Planctomycetaceae bacterium]
MKIIADREKLLASFQTAASVAPTRSPKPILQNVKLETTENGSTLIATDLEVGIRLDVPGIQVETTGVVLLPERQFGSILRESTDEKLAIESNDQGTLVRGDRSNFQLASEDPDEFPEVVVFEEEKYHEVPARLFKELIRRTAFATDTESSRYALGGVMLELEEDKVISVGTDGRRLAKMEGPAQSVGGHVSNNSQTIVPTRSMQLIDKALFDDDAEIRVAARANDLLVKSPRATIFSRLVEGRFPKWREVIPQWQDAQSIELAVGPFFSALRQAAIVSSEESRGIDFIFGEGSLELAGSTAEIGNTRVSMPITYSGPSIQITLDHRYVGDFLKVLDPEKSFTLGIRDSESAGYCSTSDGYGYVVMPLAKERP